MASQQPTDGKTKSRQGTNFKDSDLVLLCRAWVSVSEDPAIGKDQTKDQLWARIAEKYNFLACNGGISHGGGLQKDCLFFNAKYKEVERLNESGANDAWMMKTAKDLFAAQCGHKFKYDDCWEVLKVCPKFDGETTSVFDMTRPQPEDEYPEMQTPSQLQLEGSPVILGPTEESPDEVDLESPSYRPEGRKARKAGARETGKRKSASHKMSDANMKQLLQQHAELSNEYKFNQETNRKLKLEMFREKEARIKAAQKEEDDSNFMMMDTSKLSDVQREWVEQKRAEMVRRGRFSSESSSGSGM